MTTTKHHTYFAEKPLVSLDIAMLCSQWESSVEKSKFVEASREFGKFVKPISLKSDGSTVDMLGLATGTKIPEALKDSTEGSLNYNLGQQYILFFNRLFSPLPQAVIGHTEDSLPQMGVKYESNPFFTGLMDMLSRFRGAEKYLLHTVYQDLEKIGRLVDNDTTGFHLGAKKSLALAVYDAGQDWLEKTTLALSKLPKGAILEESAGKIPSFDGTFTEISAISLTTMPDAKMSFQVSSSGVLISEGLQDLVRDNGPLSEHLRDRRVVRNTVNIEGLPPTELEKVLRTALKKASEGKIAEGEVAFEQTIKSALTILTPSQNVTPTSEGRADGKSEVREIL